jgi:hypothetical protein
MTQQTLEILSDELIAPSLLESKYPKLITAEDSLAVKYSPDSEDFIAAKHSLAVEYFPDSEYSLDSGYSLGSEYSLDSEDFIATEYFLASKNPIFSQEIEVDSLTGVSNDPTVNARDHGRRTNALRDPRLQIDLFSHTNQARVTATVKVELSPLVKFLIEADFVDFTLKSTVWGIDRGYFTNGNDHLFNFSDQIITGEGNYTFSQVVPRSALNEDRSWFDNRDEIAASFSLTSSDNAFPLNLTAWTNTITGRF